MEEVKKLLGDDLFNQIAAKLGEQELFLYPKGQKVIVDDGKLIPKHRLDEVIGQRDDLKKMVEDNDKSLKALKKAAEGNTDLTRQIEDLQAALKEAKSHAEEREKLARKSFAVKDALMNSGVSDPDARDLLALKFDLETLEVDEKGKVKGFDGMVKPFKENKAFSAMFGEIKLEGQEHADGTIPTPIGKLDADLKKAQEKGDFLAVVSLKRQIAEERSKVKHE